MEEQDRILKGIRDAWRQLTPEEKEQVKKQFAKLSGVLAAGLYALPQIMPEEEILPTLAIIFGMSTGFGLRKSGFRKFVTIVEKNLGESIYSIASKLRTMLPQIEKKFAEKLHKII